MSRGHGALQRWLLTELGAEPRELRDLATSWAGGEPTRSHVEALRRAIRRLAVEGELNTEYRVVGAGQVQLLARRAFHLEDARAYITKVRWQYAKTMPKWPHEYTVRAWRPDLNEEFERFGQYILEHGVVRPWPFTASKTGEICARCGLAHGRARYHHRYLYLDGLKYWLMVDNVEQLRWDHPDPTFGVNRAELEPVDSIPQQLPRRGRLGVLDHGLAARLKPNRRQQEDAEELSPGVEVRRPRQETAHMLASG